MCCFFQWMCGYICGVITGNQLNRFLNLCCRNGIRIWGIHHDCDRIRFCFCIRDYRRLCPFLRKTRTHLRICRKRGFPFWCHRHRRAKWCCCGFMIIFFVYLYSKNYIWNIDIIGNKNISQTEILNFLEKNNVSKGISTKEIDCSLLETKIRNCYDPIGWVSVSVEDTNLRVELKESLYESYKEETDCPYLSYDFISEKNAKIISIVTRTGTANVSAGMEVKQGDKLILGYYNIYDDAGEVKDIQYVKADGEIIADVEYTCLGMISEFEIISMKIANQYTDNTLYFASELNQKNFIDSFNKEVQIVQKNVMIKNNDKGKMIQKHYTIREQIGIVCPMEVNAVHESQ